MERILKLQQSLEKQPWDGYLVEDPLDLQYLTGEKFSVGQLWITAKETLLLVDQRYIENAKVKLSQSISVRIKSWDEILDFCRKHSIRKIAFDAEKTTYSKFKELEEKLSSVTWEPISSITQDFRKIKTEEEIVLLRKSAQILWEGYLYIKTILREGISEKEIAKAFEIYCLQKGADRLSFDPIIAFGENSALPHYRAGKATLKKGDLVLIDIGVVFEGYASDMTRVVFFGDPDPFLFKWLEIAIEAQNASIQICRDGVGIKELDIAARAIFQKYGVEQYFVHSLGHGIGLEVHEFPRLRKNEEGLLIENMVVTIEPGLYLPGKGGVRYEDMVIVTKTGCENLFPIDKAIFL